MVGVRVATERCFLVGLRRMCADKRVGGARANPDCCDGAVFDVDSKVKVTGWRLVRSYSCMLAAICKKRGRLHRSLANI